MFVLNSVAHLAVAVLNDHEHWSVLALHGSVQCLNAHTVLRCAKGQRPRVPNGPWWEIPGELWGGGGGGREIIKKKGRSEAGGKKRERK